MNGLVPYSDSENDSEDDTTTTTTTTISKPTTTTTKGTVKKEIDNNNNNNNNNNNIIINKNRNNKDDDNNDNNDDDDDDDEIVSIEDVTTNVKISFTSNSGNNNNNNNPKSITSSSSFSSPSSSSSLLFFDKDSQSKSSIWDTISLPTHKTSQKQSQSNNSIRSNATNASAHSISKKKKKKKKKNNNKRTYNDMIQSDLTKNSSSSSSTIMEPESSLITNPNKRSKKLIDILPPPVNLNPIVPHNTDKPEQPTTTTTTTTTTKTIPNATETTTISRDHNIITNQESYVRPWQEKPVENPMASFSLQDSNRANADALSQSLGSEKKKHNPAHLSATRGRIPIAVMNDGSTEKPQNVDSFTIGAPIRDAGLNPGYAPLPEAEEYMEQEAMKHRMMGVLLEDMNHPSTNDTIYMNDDGDSSNITAGNINRKGKGKEEGEREEGEEGEEREEGEEDMFNLENVPESWKKEILKQTHDKELTTVEVNSEELRNKDWKPSFEIDDIMKQEKKIIPTKKWNPETGEVDTVSKFTKTQRKKHQINTLAYDMQDQALKLALRQSSAFRTKAETQMRYGW